jgi:hypothetical protein
MSRTVFSSTVSVFAILIGAALVVAEDHPVPNLKGGTTAWGKPVNGLQAGVRCPKERQSIAPGEEANLEIVIRNVSDQPIAFSYLPPQYGAENDKGTVELKWLYQGKGFPDTVHIHPRKEMLLGELALGHIRPKLPNTAYAARLELPPGMYQVGSANVVVTVKGDQTDWKLGTGYLDVELLKKR